MPAPQTPAEAAGSGAKSGTVAPQEPSTEEKAKGEGGKGKLPWWKLW
jgi:hypothetical protein